MSEEDVWIRTWFCLMMRPCLALRTRLDLYPRSIRILLNDFSLYKGNVPANLGGRASSVLKIRTHRGGFDKWKYQGGVGPITSRFTAEGPIKKDKTSLLMAGRISHANWVLNLANDPDVRKSSLFFYDGFVGLKSPFFRKQHCRRFILFQSG